ncbi:MAG: intersectin-EH binding protein Ibp1 [Actinobacteria bacterium]|nr:intersectin-EH binding protein Ibp1 [Actinomycetota bacterium]
MATFPFSVRRLILAGGFAAAAVAAPAIVAVSAPAATFAPLAQTCPAGEEEDLYTGVCVPHTVPNSGSVPNSSGGSFQSIPGNPNLPAVDGIPCTGANTGQCIGLSEENQAMGPAPTSTFGDGRNG